MKPTRHWLGHLTLAGASLVWAGCGGSDVPDPSSDSAAAAEPTAKTVDGAAAAEAPVVPESSAEAKPPSGEPTPRPDSVAEATPSPAPTVTSGGESSAVAPATASAEPAGEAAKGDTSGTDEMMRMAANPPQANASSDPSPAVASAPAPGLASASGPASLKGGSQSGEPPREQREPRGDTMPEVSPTGRRGGEDAAREAGQPGRRGGGGGLASGAEGGRGGPGPSSSGGGGNDSDGGPNAFQRPGTAVQAFLSAVKAKDKDRLSQATARRSVTEAVEKHQKIFAAILEQSISDEELDDMAKSLEGFQVQTVLQAKSTGRTGVVIGKMDNRDRLQRTVQVRLEKEGWKVLDLGGLIDFKPVGTMRSPYGKRR